MVSDGTVLHIATCIPDLLFTYRLCYTSGAVIYGLGIKTALVSVLCQGSRYPTNCIHLASNQIVKCGGEALNKANYYRILPAPQAPLLIVLYFLRVQSCRMHLQKINDCT